MPLLDVSDDKFNILSDNIDLLNNNHIIVGDMAYTHIVSNLTEFNYSNSNIIHGGSPVNNSPIGNSPIGNSPTNKSNNINGHTKATIQVLEIVTKLGYISSLIQSILMKYEKYKSKIVRDENILFQNNLNVIKVTIYTDKVKMHFIIYNIIYDIPYIIIKINNSNIYISDIPFILYIYSYKLLVLHTKYKGGKKIKDLNDRIKILQHHKIKYRSLKFF